MLVAGAGETVLTWAPVFPELVARGRIIAYDRAGLGSSDPHRRSTAQTALEDLAAVVSDVGPAVVVGHSWGGLLAQMLALTRPDLVAGLVLVDPTHEDVVAAIPLRMRLAEEAMMRGIVVRHWLGRAKPIVHVMALDLADHSTSDDATRARLISAYEASYATTSQLSTIGRENRISNRCGGWVRKIRTGNAFPPGPVEMLMAGNKPFAERSRKLNESVVVGAECTLVEDSGHYIHRDSPESVLNGLDRVLRPDS